MLVFCLVAPLIDASAKLASATIPLGQITAARFVLQAALMIPVLAVMSVPLAIRKSDIGLVVLRAMLLIASTYTFVAAVRVMPLADALAIVFVEPFILMLLGYAFFAEAVGPRRIIASALAFAGCLFVIRPSITLFGGVALYPLATALSFALYMLVTRQLSARVHPVAMQMQTALFGAAICLPALALADGSGIAALDPVWPGGREWLWLLGVGAAATVSHLAITYALKFAPSATLAPLGYLEIIVSVALGYAVFGDFPTPFTWIGIAIISAAGIYLIHRERIEARSRAQGHAALPATPHAAG